MATRKKARKATKARKKAKSKKQGGYIYILTNPALKPNWLKIGRTTRTPRERATEISRSTGVPMPFEVVHELPVNDCVAAEKAVHEALDRYRAADNREFFVLPLSKAVELVQKHASPYQRASWLNAALARKGHRSRGLALALELVPGLFLQTFGLGHIYRGMLGRAAALMIVHWGVVAGSMALIFNWRLRWGAGLWLAGWLVAASLSAWSVTRQGAGA